MRRLVLAATLILGLTAAALADDTRVHVRGTIAGFDAATLTLAGAAGSTTKFALPPDAKFLYIVKIDPSAVVAGANVGITAVPEPDGSLRAIEVHLIPPGALPGGGSSTPYDLAPQSSMTNGTVDTIAATKIDKVDARTLTVKYQGGEKQIVVPANIPYVGYTPADKSALATGAHVIVFAVKKDDGSLIAGAVAIGKDGLVPPM